MSEQSNEPTARLVLENGAVFTGFAFGCTDPLVVGGGEVVFNTALTGYQEALTDPSYAGQILVMTTPLIGNYGTAPDDVESERPQVAGFVVRELARRYSNHRATSSLHDWLAAAGVPGISGIDTRALVRMLRTAGAMRGVISADSSETNDQLVARARAIPQMAGQNLACGVTVGEKVAHHEGLGEWRPSVGMRGGVPEDRRFKVAALDCGGKRSIYGHLVERGCEVVLFPYDATVEEIRAAQPDGLFISNGPGDPDAVDVILNTLRTLAGEIPTFGICLGHQLIALALGAKTFKLKFGHRGANQPVRNSLTGRVEITSQNHGFCVDEATLPPEVEPTHIHLNDKTLAGIRHRSKPILSVQYHPEASPGPHDSGYLFDCFVEMMRTGQPVDADVFRAAQSLEPA